MHEVKPTEARRGPVALLKTRRFGPLWVTQFFSAFNDNAVKNALVLMLAYQPEMVRGPLPASMLIPLSSAWMTFSRSMVPAFFTASAHRRKP